MNFLDTPGQYTRTARTARDVCRDACAIEPAPKPRESLGHALIAPACVLAALGLLYIIVTEVL